MRPLRLVWLVMGLNAAACGDDPFSVEAAVGVWDLQALNGTPIPGDRPTGVVIRNGGGTDSTVTALQSLVVQFATGAACSWTVDDGFSGATTQSDCEYAVSQSGTLSLDLVGFFGSDRGVSGTGGRGELMLTDQDTNEYRLRKRP